MDMAGMLRVSRSRGAFSGIVLILLGVWGGLIPLVGPYVNYAYTPDQAWTLTSGRIWLEILPAAATVLGGLLLLASRLRPVALLGGTLAILSGAWFAIGRVLAPLWRSTGQGTPVGGQLARALEQIGFFAGLGLVIICVASVALGRLSVVSVRDTRAASDAAAARAAASTEPVTTEPVMTEPVTTGPATTGPVPTSTAPTATVPARAADEDADDDDVAGPVYLKKVASKKETVSSGTRTE
jgi:hypothetical protein